MEEFRTPETLPNQLQSCKATLQEYYKRRDDTSKCQHRFRQNSSCIRGANKFKSNQKAGKRKPKWNLEEIKNNENDGKEVIEENVSQINEFSGSLEDSQGQVWYCKRFIILNDEFLYQTFIL